MANQIIIGVRNAKHEFTMKTKPHSLFLLLALLALSTINSQFSTVRAQGTAFTYQGRLNVNGSPANGLYDFTFSLSENAQGSVISAVTGTLGVPVTNGLFTTMIDFGSGQFVGTSNWLLIAVRTNLVGNYTNLTPLVPITPTPYAIFANTASNLSGTVSSTKLSGAIPSALLTSVPATSLTGTILQAQLPASIITNGASGVNISGTFSGNGAGVTNVTLGSLSANNDISWGNFLPASTNSTGNNPYSVIAVDVNGNGKLELITANSSANTLTVLTNAGNGVFGISATLNVGNEPENVISADVNGDGRPDLISGNFASGTLTIYTNNGSGGFGSNATVVVSGIGSGVGTPCAVDVNGDGKVDLLVPLWYSNTVAVWTNNGSGGFGSNATYNVGTNPVCVISADVNGDGRPDFICSSYTGHALTIYTNNGSGGFGSNATLSAGFDLYGVTAADVNGDGYVDLISASPEGNGDLAVWTNNESGGFRFSANYFLGLSIGPFTVAAADVNGDGYLDLITESFYNNTLIVLTNNGSGGFAIASTPGVGNEPHGLCAADVNGDGKVDLVSANSGDSTVTVLFNTPAFNGIFTGNGSGLTSLTASNLTGTLPSSSLPASVVTNTETGVTLSGTFNGNGGGLTNLNASQLSGGTVPAASLPVNVVTNTETGVTLSGTFNGNGGGLTNLNINLANVSGALPSSTTYTVSGNQSGGFGSPVLLVTNANTGSTAAPALRVVGYGNSSAGVLSVSSQGTGLLAQFGNAGAFVADITTNGTVDAAGFNGGTLRVGSSGTTFTNVEAGQALMPSGGSSLVETNLIITYPQAFTTVPKVIVSVANDPAFQDLNNTFVVSVSSNSVSAFRVNVLRVDTAAGWTQQLRINWQAWQ
jgi:hypothetical protein